MKYCTQCGNKISADSLFCSKCGEKIQDCNENTTANINQEQTLKVDSTGNKIKSAGRVLLVWYLVAGSINYFGQQFNKSSIDEGIIITIAILAGTLFYKLRGLLKIKSEVLRNISAYFILLFISAFLIGVLTSLVGARSIPENRDSLIKGEFRAYFIEQLTSQCINSVASKGDSSDQTPQYCSCVANKLADVTTIRDTESNMSPDYKEKAAQAAADCL